MRGVSIMISIKNFLNIFLAILLISCTNEYNRARSLYQNKEYPKAFNLYLKLAKSGDAKAQNDLGIMYLEGFGVKKDLKRAGLWFNKSAKQKNIYAVNNLAYVLALLGRHRTDAINLSNYAIKKIPNQPLFMHTSAIIEYRFGNLQEAIRILKKANSMQPNNPIILNDLGNSYYGIKNKDMAEKNWKMALNFEKNKQVKEFIVQKIQDLSSDIIVTTEFHDMRRESWLPKEGLVDIKTLE